MTSKADGGRFDLSGKVALVTGASGGFGAQFAETLAEQGAQVILSGRRADVLHETAERINGRVIVADLKDFDAAAVFYEAEGCFGQPISILVNNAGVGHAEKAIELPADLWDHVLQVNLTAAFYLTQVAAQRMMECGITGSIINVASIFADRPVKGMIAYATAKAGLIAMTKCWALELNGKIRVNALAPGWHLTEMTDGYLSTPRGRSIVRDIPAGRFGLPGGLSNALLLLACDDYINGTVLTVDGGLSCGMKDGGIAKI